MADDEIRIETHDARQDARACITTNAAGIAINQRVMYCLPDGPWKAVGHGGDGDDTAHGVYEYAIPPLVNGSLVMAQFAAAGRAEGDRFRVGFSIKQDGSVLARPDKPWDETLKLGKGGRLEWGWIFELA